MNVHEAIESAEATLPGVAAPDGQPDARWQAIIEVAGFIEDEPELVWLFVERWGQHSDKDLRAAIVTCLLEHLLEAHFDLLFPRVRDWPDQTRASQMPLECAGHLEKRSGRRMLPE